MKQILFALVVSMTASHALAECYNFVNSKGPSRIGNAVFGDAASQVCVTPELITFTTGKNQAFAEVVTISQVRCDGDCLQYTLGQVDVGNTTHNSKGAIVTVNLSNPDHTNTLKGVLEIRAGRSFPERYSIVQTPNDGNH